MKIKMTLKWRMGIASMRIVQLLASIVFPVLAQADINHPDQIFVEYDTSVNNRMKEKKRMGETPKQSRLL